ncbi:MAG: hypothetical protein CHACPFDD_00548 [Phycisphaerae bacterium]|nr:hypothetical protein [Phycisphaerae bacterium]
MKHVGWAGWIAAGLTTLIIIGCVGEAPESLLLGDGVAKLDQAAKPNKPPGGDDDKSGGSNDNGKSSHSGSNDNGGANDNGTTNDNGAGNDNGTENENDNGVGNDNGGNDNGVGNDNGTENENGNDNGAENENGNDNGAENENGNDNGTGNDNGGNDNGGGGTCGDGSTQVATTLTSSGGAEGEMEYRDLPGGCKRFRARVENFAAATTFSVFINGVDVGQITTDSRGRGELRYDTEDGTFPADFPGITVGDVGDVGHVATGTFGSDCSNANCNG